VCLPGLEMLKYVSLLCMTCSFVLFSVVFRFYLLLSAPCLGQFHSRSTFLRATYSLRMFFNAPPNFILCFGHVIQAPFLYGFAMNYCFFALVGALLRAISQPR
jgi:hypothetical protein